MKQLTVLGKEELCDEAKNAGAPFELVRMVAKPGKLPVPNFSAGGIATPADAALVMQLGAEAVFVGSGIFMKERATPLDVENNSTEREEASLARQGHRAGDDALQRSQGPRRSQRERHRHHEGSRRRRHRGARTDPDPRLVRPKRCQHTTKRTYNNVCMMLFEWDEVKRGAITASIESDSTTQLRYFTIPMP